MPQRPRFRPTAGTSHTRGVRAVDITFSDEAVGAGAPTLPCPLLSQLPTRAAFPARFYRRARAGGRGKFASVLSSAAGAECRIYFNDQVTGRLVERSGWVYTNLSRRVYVG